MKPIRKLMKKSMGWVSWVMPLIAAVLLADHAGAAMTEYTCAETPELLELPVVGWAKMLIVQGDGIDASHTQGVSINPAGDGSGNFLVTGSAWTDAGENEYGLVVKMDPSGNLLDAATFFDIAQENGIYAIQPVYDASSVLEGYVAGGFKYVSHPAPGTGTWFQPDAWLMKLDLSLDRTWGSTFGMPGEDWANAVLQNGDGFLFGGNLRDITASYGGWLFQTDESGNGLWSISTYWYCSRVDEIDPLYDPCPEPHIPTGDGTHMGDTIHAMLPTVDGGCLTADGRTMKKWDGSGNWVWDAAADAATVIKSGDDLFAAGVVITGVDETALALTRVSAAGAVGWSTRYGRDVTDLEYFSPTEIRNGIGIAEASDGGFHLAGRLEMFESGSRESWLIKTLPGTEGVMDWALDLPELGLHSARPMMMTADGDLILVGSIACDGETRLLVMRIGVGDLQAPEAAFTMAPEAPYCVDQEIAFDGSASSDPDGTIASYEWDFGDGTVETGTETTTHRYALAGDYTVTLMVRDDHGLPAFNRQTITVGLPGVLWERVFANTPGCLEQTSCTTGVRAYDIIAGVDGGFVISGRSNFLYSGTRYDAWLLKLFDNGIRHWEKNLTDDPDVVEQGSGLTATADGGYAVAGTFMPYGGDEGDIRTMLIKTDSSGTPAWHRVYTDYAGADEDVSRRSVLSLDNGEYLVGGHRRSDAGYRNMWLLRTDADGWEIPGASRLFPPQEDDWNSSVCLSIAPALSEGFVLTGYYGNQGSTAPLPVLKTDDAGDLEWSFHWPAASWNKKRGFWVAAVADGYLVAGQANSNYGRAAVMKVSADGSESAWVAHVPFVSHGISGVVDGALTADGGVAIVGWINAPNMYFPSRLFVAKFTAEGVCQWHQVFEDDADHAYGTGILALDDGSLLVLGDECRYSGYGCRSRLRKIGPDLGPAAAFDMDVREGGTPLSVQFSDLTTGGSAPYTYAWDVDDDGTVDATDPNPVHIYESRGTYSVRLDITDGNGLTDSFVCEDCVLAYYTGIYTEAVGVEITGFSVTDDAASEPETYDFQLAPEGLDAGGAFGFTLEATGPDGSHAFRITFPSPYDPGMTLYKLPDWDVIPYTVIDAYTIEVVLDIVDGELDPAFVLAAFLPLKTLSIAAEVGGTTDPAPGDYSHYVDGSLVVTVTAIPDACWQFENWSGSVAGTVNPVTVELNRYSGDTSLTAHFAASVLLGSDYDCDGDVDGVDLFEFISDPAGIEPDAFAANFGMVD